MPVPIPPASSTAPTAVVSPGAREPEPIAALLEAASAKPAITTDGFARVVNNALDTASGVEYNADSVSTQGSSGEQKSVSDLRMSGSESDASGELTMANRGRALAAFNEILAMQM